jgi:photosystem II stability/assembly factor-like uncharacterized protein
MFKFFLFGVLIIFSVLGCRPEHDPIPPVLSDPSNEAPPGQFFAQRLAPDRSFSVRAYGQALKQAARQKREKSQRPGFDRDWIVRGPANVGARVNTIAVHPEDDSTLYIGYSTGGVFKTTDGGASWTPVFDDQPFTSIGDIAIDPRDPDILYVGTGDPNISGYPFIGDGLYRSRDAGRTWEHLGLEEQRIISKIVLHPEEEKTLYAATMGLPFVPNRQRGLYRSRDGGNSWEQILFVDEGAGIIDLIMDPSDAQTLYAVSWDRIRNNRETIADGPNGGVYKSTDGGDSWRRLMGGLPQGRTGRIALAIAKSNPQVLVALFLDSQDELENIYRTENGGTNWSPILDRTANNGLPARPLGSLGWYLGRIEIHPEDDRDIFMLGVRLWRTRDNGQRWVLATSGSSGIHVDNHDLVFGPTGTIYLGTDGGLYRSTNNGFAWTDAENIPATQLYRTAFNPHQPDWYYGGAQDNGTVGGVDVAENWRRIFGADGFQMQFHPERPEIFYVEIQGGGIYYTQDGGRQWSSGTKGIANGDRRNWDAPYQISAHRPSVLYTGTYRLYRSDSDSLPAWTPISGDLTRGDLWGGRFNTISTLHESPVDSLLLYVGTTDGLVWRTDDGGQNWRQITTGLPDRYVTSIKASPLGDRRVIITHSGYRDNDFVPHIHLSEDRGVTWAPIAGNLPPLAINDVYILPGFEDEILFSATDGGVYATIDRGQSWDCLGVNMPIVPAYDLEWNPERVELVAATFGRSIQSYPLEGLIDQWERSVVSVDEPATHLNWKIYPNPVSDRLNVENLSAGNDFWMTVWNVAGQPLARRRVGPGATEILEVGDWAAGVYYVVLENDEKRRTALIVKR